MLFSICYSFSTCCCLFSSNLCFAVPVILQELSSFTLEKTDDGGVKMETGKGKCPFEPSQHYTAVMAGKHHCTFN